MKITIVSRIVLLAIALGSSALAKPSLAQCQVDALRPALPPGFEMRWLCMSDNRMAVSGLALGSFLWVLEQQGGDWVEEAYFDLGERFGDNERGGGQVVLEGDTLAVGAPFTNVAGQWNVGSVLVYRQVLGTWTLEQELFPAPPVDPAGFGGALALEGDTLVVGEAFPTDYIREGRVHVFVRQGAIWTEEAVLTGPAVAGDFFGQNSVALQGSRLAVGAPRNAFSTTSSGEVYVFEGSGATWSEPELLSASELPPGARFGFTMALDGETLAVSSQEPGTELCSAFVFVHDGGAWSRQARLTLPPGSTSFGRFGPSLGLVGDRLLAGHPRDLTAGPHAGAVYLFARSSDVWTESDVLYGDDTGPFDGFGRLVSWEGGMACIAGGGPAAQNAYLFALDDPNCPGATFAASPAIGGAPLSVSFTDQSSGSVTSWEWSFGDGASATEQHPSHTYVETGDYTVGLIARGPSGSSREIAVDAILVRTAASASVRNGSGVNDLCYASTSLPLLGNTWTAEVDASAHAGASLTFLLAYVRPRAPLPTPRGEILIDLTSARIVGVTAVPDPAGIARYSLPIPSDLALEGFALATQAGILGSIELCNAVDLVLGF